jgi:hypothetical protein
VQFYSENDFDDIFFSSLALNQFSDKKNPNFLSVVNREITIFNGIFFLFGFRSTEIKIDTSSSSIKEEKIECRESSNFVDDIYEYLENGKYGNEWEDIFCMLGEHNANIQWREIYVIHEKIKPIALEIYPPIFKDESWKTNWNKFTACANNFSVSGIASRHGLKSSGNIKDSKIISVEDAQCLIRESLIMLISKTIEKEKKKDWNWQQFRLLEFADADPDKPKLDKNQKFIYKNQKFIVDDL